MILDVVVSYEKNTPLRGSQESIGSLNPRIFLDLDEFIIYNDVDVANDRQGSVPYFCNRI